MHCLCRPGSVGAWGDGLGALAVWSQPVAVRSSTMRVTSKVVLMMTARTIPVITTIDARLTRDVKRFHQGVRTRPTSQSVSSVEMGSDRPDRAISPRWLGAGWLPTVLAERLKLDAS